MGTSDTYSKVIELIAETLDADIENLSEDTTFSELQADSFDMLDLASAIEDEFNVEIPDEPLESILTIGDIVEFLDEE
jgi:acyl carrier protein